MDMVTVKPNKNKLPFFNIITVLLLSELLFRLLLCNTNNQYICNSVYVKT